MRSMREDFAAVRDDVRALCAYFAGGLRVDALAVPMDQDLIKECTAWSPSCRVSRIAPGLRRKDSRRRGLRRRGATGKDVPSMKPFGRFGDHPTGVPS